MGALDILVGNTDITTATFYVSGSYRFNEHSSLGIGLDVVYGKGDFSRGSSQQFVDNLLSVEGAGVGIDGIIGALWQLNENHRFGMSYRVSPDIAAEGGTNNLTGESIGDVELKEHAWKDSWLFSVGATWTLNPDWTLRAGHMHDSGVVGDVASLSIPDSDRQWYSFGVGYNLSTKSILDFGIASIRGEEVEVTEAAVGSAVRAKTLSDAVYYAAQYSYRF